MLLIERLEIPVSTDKREFIKKFTEELIPAASNENMTFVMTKSRLLNYKNGQSFFQYMASLYNGGEDYSQNCWGGLVSLGNTWYSIKYQTKDDQNNRLYQDFIYRDIITSLKIDNKFAIPLEEDFLYYEGIF